MSTWKDEYHLLVKCPICKVIHEKYDDLLDGHFMYFMCRCAHICILCLCLCVYCALMYDYVCLSDCLCFMCVNVFCVNVDCVSALVIKSNPSVNSSPTLFFFRIKSITNCFLSTIVALPQLWLCNTINTYLSICQQWFFLYSILYKHACSLQEDIIYDNLV